MREAGVGDPADPRTEVGPLINERRYRAVLAAIEQARDVGGRLLAGGDVPDRQGRFVAPTHWSPGRSAAQRHG